MTTQLQLADLAAGYLGSFRLPQGRQGPTSAPSTATFSFANGAMAYNPAGNGGAGSLFIVGHAQGQLVAEVGIPTPAVGAPAAVPVAPLLQQFADVTGGAVPLGSGSGQGQWNIGGLLVSDDTLLWSANLYYDAAAPPAAWGSHGFSSVDLSAVLAHGPYKLAALTPGHVGGPMALVPPDWLGQFGYPVLTGLGGVPIAVRTSAGPAAVGFDPTTLGPVPAPSAAFLDYPLADPLGGALQAQSDLWNLASTFCGAAFISAGGKAAWLAFGRRGTGLWWYGLPNAGPNGEVDAYQTGKGGHAPPYVETALLYDPADMLAARAGIGPIWKPQPYEVGQVPGLTPTGYGQVGGAALDVAGGRLFVSQLYGDCPAGTYLRQPLIHCFSVA